MSVTAQRYGTWKSVLINAFWVPLHFQDTALIAISVPAALLVLSPGDHVRVFAVIAALVSFVSMIVPPIAGAISDRLRLRGVPRRIPIIIGAALDVACLVMMAEVHSLGLFMTFLLLATLGANISLAAYQALIPDVVPQASWGTVSGVRSVAMVVGTVVGIGVAAGTYPASTFIGIAIGIGLGAITLFAVGEHVIPNQPQEHAHISDWHDFTIVFLGRAFLAFGLSLLMTFVLYFFRDILHAANPSGATGLVAAASLVGAIGSGIFLGWLSDRVSRKIVVALCGLPMAMAAAGFGLVPQEHWMFVFAALFGVGFGGIMSTGWALAMDSVPQLRDVARDLGIWGIAQNFPAVIAPLAGGWILAAYGGSLGGYQVLFFAAAASFLFGSLVVLAVGKRPLIPWWGVPLRVASAISMQTYLRAAYRIRSWGRLARNRGASLVIANHQIDLDLMPLISHFVLRGGRRSPVLVACAKLMYEPGFMAVRIPWLWRAMKNVNLGWLFEGMGLLPLENELQSRSIARWAWGAQRRHGVLPLDEVFKPAVLERTGFSGVRTNELFTSTHFRTAQDTYVRLSDLNVSYRKEAFDEMKAGVEQDLQRIEDALKRGATFLVTPEGEYTTTGLMLPFRGIWDRLLPVVEQVFLASISYDPFVGTRLAQYVRITQASDKATAIEELKAARPVTTSALLSEWLLARDGSFTEDEATAAIASRVASLPPALFIEPRLARNARKMTILALRRTARLRILECSGERYTLSQTRTHPQFPGVEDIVAFQARFLGETLETARAVDLPNERGPSGHPPRERARVR
ncbi:MAG TPA: MFS transporter [Candidatus Baltobacteraceae bacterium]|nr:MFS transporter [Candidatus Baltobacteraceae bacterium]